MNHSLNKLYLKTFSAEIRPKSTIEPLQVDGKIAAINRQPGEGDIRRNIHAGASANKAKVTSRMLEIIDTIKPRLIHDGMFLVGLDIIGDKLVEINVLTPGGIISASELLDTDFYQPVIDALQQKKM